jgi:hypothetical protein
MRSPRSLLLPLAAVLAVLPLVTAGSAGALTTKAYTVSFKGTVQTDWNVPKYMRYATCFDTEWVQGSGSETWNVRSQGNKVLVTNNGVASQFQFGSWELNAGSTTSGLVGKGETHRSGGYKTTYTAGTCGVGPQQDDPAPATDCGTRLVKYEIQLSFYKGEITPDVLASGNGVREKIRYENCTLVTPSNILAGSWPAVSGKLKDRKLLKAGKPFTVKGHDRAEGKGGVSNLGTATTTIDWALTFTPAKAPKKVRRR